MNTLYVMDTFSAFLVCGKVSRATRSARGRTSKRVHSRLEIIPLKSIHYIVKKYLFVKCSLHSIGINGDPERKETKQGEDIIFGTNFLSHFLLTDLLLPRIKVPPPSDLFGHQTCVVSVHFGLLLIPWHTPSTPRKYSFTRQHLLHWVLSHFLPTDLLLPRIKVG